MTELDCIRCLDCSIVVVLLTATITFDKKLKHCLLHGIHSRDF